MNTEKSDPLRSALAGKAESWEYVPAAGRAVGDARQAARLAVQSPEEFPSVEQAIVDGDSVTIAFDPNVPQPEAILQGLIDALPLDQIASLVVLLGDEATEATVESIRAVMPDGVEVVVHDPRNRDELGYLAANEGADPIYLNRHLTNADFVLPVTVGRLSGALDPVYDAGAVFPMLADAASQQRFRSARLSGKEYEREPAEAAWLLGFPMLVVVSPTADGDVGRVVAGTPAGIDRLLAVDFQANWQRGGAQTAELVIACLNGSQQQQTWENLGRALFIAKQLVEPEGTVVILSSIDRRPGPAIRRLRGLQQGDEEATRQQILKDKHRDVTTAAVLLDATRDGRVVLYSQLPPEEVEELGIGAMNAPESLKRLIAAHESCGILRGAQFCAPAALEPHSD